MYIPLSSLPHRIEAPLRRSVSFDGLSEAISFIFFQFRIFGLLLWDQQGWRMGNGSFTSTMQEILLMQGVRLRVEGLVDSHSGCFVEICLQDWASVLFQLFFCEDIIFLRRVRSSMVCLRDFLVRGMGFWSCWVVLQVWENIWWFGKGREGIYSPQGTVFRFFWESSLFLSQASVESYEMSELWLVFRLRFMFLQRGSLR